MPNRGEKNTTFGVYRNVCCGVEVMLSEGAKFPDCPRHVHLPAIWKLVGALPEHVPGVRECDFLDPTPEEQIVILIDAAELSKAAQLIIGCESCSDDAEIPFDNVLDNVTGSDPKVTDYIMERPPKCPSCFREITEKTLVEIAL
jgi:hypothetical protein